MQVSILVLVSSIFILIYAYQLPLERIQETVLYEYISKGIFDNAIILHPNILYEDNVLKNPDKVFLKLADKIIVGIIYTFSSKPFADQVNNILDVDVSLSHPQLWSRKINYTIIESKETVIKHIIELDIAQVISLAKNISQVIDVPSNKYTVAINCNAKTTFNIAGEVRVVNFPFSLQINIDLAGKVIEFSQREFTNSGVQKNNEVVESTIRIGNINIEIRSLRQISLILLATSSAFTIIVLGVNISNFYMGRGKNLMRSIRKYRSLIIESDEIAESKPDRIIRVKTLDELVKVADYIVKPIVHLKISNKDMFFVLDGDVKYIYEYEHMN